MASVPPNSDALAGLPSWNALADSIDDSDNFMPRNSRLLNPRKKTLFCDRIAVANSTGLHLDSDCPRTWLRDFTFHNFK
jgi:hypothetical protein